MLIDERVRLLALQLVVSCFCFEKSAVAELQPDDSYECKGGVVQSVYSRQYTTTRTRQIHCRLLPESEDICELGSFWKKS